MFITKILQSRGKSFELRYNTKSKKAYLTEAFPLDGGAVGDIDDYKGTFEECFARAEKFLEGLPIRGAF